jgi:glutathione peroxidase
MLIRGSAIVVLLGFAAVAAAQAPAPKNGAGSLYDLTATTLEGKPEALRAFAGKVSLVVNVASRCGYTPQYAGLEALYRDLKDRGFVILGFPSNDFGGQEPGTAAEIRQFCSLTYDVTFPMFDKVITKAGAAQSPVYALLQRQAGHLPGWNFAKYLVGRDGRAVRFYPTGVTPEDPGLRRDIELALAVR